MSDDGDYDVDAGDFDGDDIADDMDDAGGAAAVLAVTRLALVTLCDPCVQGSHLGRSYIQKFFFK